MLLTALLLALVGIAALTDLSSRKIYNWLTYPGIIGAVTLHGIGSLLAFVQLVDEQYLRTLGWLPYQESLLGLVLCGAVMLVCYVMFGIGGGDVKLIAMIGAFLGPYQGLETMLWTFILGGASGVVVLIWRLGVVRFVVRLFRQLMWAISLGRIGTSGQEDTSGCWPLFLAPSALAAVVMVRFGVSQWISSLVG